MPSPTNKRILKHLRVLRTLQAEQNNRFKRIERRLSSLEQQISKLRSNQDDYLQLQTHSVLCAKTITQQSGKDGGVSLQEQEEHGDAEHWWSNTTTIAQAFWLAEARYHGVEAPDMVAAWRQFCRQEPAKAAQLRVSKKV